MLFTVAGFQVPVIPLDDKFGKKGGVPNLHNPGFNPSNSGTILSLTVNVCVLCIEETAPQASVTIKEYIPADAKVATKVGFSTFDVYPFGPVQE